MINFDVEFELYPVFVQLKEQEYRLSEGQTELTYAQRMLYLRMVETIFDEMADGLNRCAKPSSFIMENYAHILMRCVPEKYHESVLFLLDSEARFVPNDYICHMIFHENQFSFDGWRLRDLFFFFKKEEKLTRRKVACEILADQASDPYKDIVFSLLEGKDEKKHSSFDFSFIVNGMIRSQKEELAEFLFSCVTKKECKDAYREKILVELANSSLEYFLRLMTLIKEQQMAKYGFVKRCIASWTKLYDKKTLKSIDQEVVEEIYAQLFGKNTKKASSGRETYLSLWAKGVTCSKDAIAV